MDRSKGKIGRGHKGRRCKIIEGTNFKMVSGTKGGYTFRKNCVIHLLQKLVHRGYFAEVLGSPRNLAAPGFTPR